MRTFTTTATVKDGRLIVELPPDFEGHRVSVQVADTEPKPEASDAEWERRLEALRELKGSVEQVECNPIMTYMRREHIYDDDGR